MNLLKVVGTGLSIAVLCFLVGLKANADEWNQKATVTLTAPVEVPGVGQHILPPGTYVFKLKSSSADRHIVEIFNQDEWKVLTALLSIPNDRLKATDKSVLTFGAGPAGDPEALKAWFHAGEHPGEQFVWDGSREMQLAKQASEPVLSTPVALASGPADALTAVPVQAVNPNGETIDASQVVEAPPAAAVAVVPTVSADSAAATTLVPTAEATVAPATPVVTVAVAPPVAVDPAAATPPSPIEEATVAPVTPTVAATAAPVPPVAEAAVTTAHRLQRNL